MGERSSVKKGLIKIAVLVFLAGYLYYDKLDSNIEVYKVEDKVEFLSLIPEDVKLPQKSEFLNGHLFVRGKLKEDRIITRDDINKKPPLNYINYNVEYRGEKFKLDIYEPRHTSVEEEIDYIKENHKEYNLDQLKEVVYEELELNGDRILISRFPLDGGRELYYYINNNYTYIVEALGEDKPSRESFIKLLESLT